MIDESEQIKPSVTDVEDRPGSSEAEVADLGSEFSFVEFRRIVLKDGTTARIPTPLELRLVLKTLVNHNGLPAPEVEQKLVEILNYLSRVCSQYDHTDDDAQFLMATALCGISLGAEEYGFPYLSEKVLKLATIQGLTDKYHFIKLFTDARNAFNGFTPNNQTDTWRTARRRIPKPR